MIVSVCSDKGSPGVTTLAAALGMVWPGERVLLDADTAGGDLPFRLWSAGPGATAGRLSPSPSIAQLATAARLGLTGAGPWPFAQDTSLGVPVVPGVLSAERFRPLRSLWPRIAAELAAWPGTVIADLGRLQTGQPGAAGGPGRDRGAAADPGRSGEPGASAGPGGGARRVGGRPRPGPVPGRGGGRPARPGPPRSAPDQVRQVLASIGSPAPVLGFLAARPGGRAGAVGRGS